MKPKKKEEKTPDLTPEEIQEGQIGGTDDETAEDAEKNETTEGEEGGGGYGRPREQGEDVPPA